MKGNDRVKITDVYQTNLESSSNKKYARNSKPIRNGISNASVVSESLSRSLNVGAEVKTIDMNNTNEDYKSIFGKYRSDWRFSALNTFQLYNICGFAEEYNLDIEDSEVISYKDEFNTQRFRVAMKYGNGYEISFHPAYNEPLDGTTFKNTIGKALLVLDKCNRIKNKMRGQSLNNSVSNMIIDFDPKIKSMDMEKLAKDANELIEVGLSFKGRKLHVSHKDYEEYLAEMNEYIFDLLDQTI